MIKILILVGVTCSGKTRVGDELVKKHGFEKLVTYTTRPPRPKEKDGVDYYFISRDEFSEKVRGGFFAEWQSYQMADGQWVSYGTSKVDIENAKKETFVILTPKGCADLAESGVHDVFIDYIYINNETARYRLKKRGDSTEEADRRLKADRADFRGFENYADKITYNNLNDSLDDVVEKVLKNYKESVIWKD